MLRAGILTRAVDPTSGLGEADTAHLLERGIGITNLAPRATARADELTTDELRAGPERLGEVVTRWHPRVVAVAGITAYRTAFGRRKAVTGLQEETIGGVLSSGRRRAWQSRVPRRRSPSPPRATTA